MIPCAPPGRAISLLGPPPGAIRITDIVALKEHYGITFDVLAVTHPAPSIPRFYTTVGGPITGSYGDTSISVDGTLQTEKKILVPVSFGSGASAYGVAYSSTTATETSAGDSFVIPQRIPNSYDSFVLLDYINAQYLKYGTNAGWTGSKYYVDVQVYVNAAFSANFDSLCRGRSFYIDGSYTTEASATPIPFSNVAPVKSLGNGGDFGTLKIPLVGPGSPVNKVSFTINYSFYPAFSVTGLSVPEYTETILSTTNLTDRIGY